MLFDRLVNEVREDVSPEYFLAWAWVDVIQYFLDSRDAYQIARNVRAAAALQGKGKKISDLD